MDTTPTFRPRPPGSWESFTRAVLIMLVFTLGIAALVAGAYVGLLLYLTGDESAGTGLFGFLIDNGGTAELFLPLLAFVSLVTAGFWRYRTREMLERYGRTDVTLVHWAMAGCFLLFGLSVLIGTMLTIDGAVDSQIRAYAIGHGIRTLALALLAVGILQLRSRVREAVATSGHAPRPGDMGIRHTPTVAAPLPRGQSDTTLDTASLPLADDQFWARVGALSATAGADLPLLESTSTLVRRWLLIPFGGDLTAVRAALTPGAMVTVYADPLRPGAEAPIEPPTGSDTWFGLIEDYGTLRFQSLKPARLPVWLSQARRASRFGLFPADAPGALTAAVPTLTHDPNARTP